MNSLLTGWTMEFDERLFYMLLGCALGFVLGYLSRMLKEIKREVNVVSDCVQDIKEEVSEIDTMVKRDHSRNEDGFMRHPKVADFFMILVLSLCLWASISTGVTNNKLEDAVEDIKAAQIQDSKQDERLETISQCTLEYTSKIIQALNERTTYSQAQADAVAEVLEAQAKFLRLVLVIPPVSDDRKRISLQAYVDGLADFNEVAIKNRDKTTKYAYPTNEALAGCLGVALPDVEKGEDKVQ